MSSVDSLLVGGSTILWSIAKKFLKADEKKQLTFAKLLTLGFGLVCLAITLFVPQMITLTLFVVYIALIFVPAIIAGLYTKKVSENAVFYSLLIPSILLFMGYVPIGKNIFLLTTILAILIVSTYDKIFKNKSEF